MPAERIRIRGARWPAAVAILVTAGAVLAGCGTAPVSAIRPTSSPPARAASPVPAQLTAAGLDLRSGPVDVPLVLRIPAIGVTVPLLGVGMTPANVMDAPEGRAGDPVWQKAFWYRGGATPGEVGTATIAGHLDDTLGRPAAFRRLSDLRAGDAIVVRDTRTGLDITFTVSETQTYSDAQASKPAVLARIYGAGPAAGTASQPAADGLAHLVLITCAGDFVHGAYDHHLTVFAERTG